MDEFPISPVVVESAIQDSIDFCQPLASISGVTLVMDSRDSKMKDVQVMSNALRLQQVLINLVSNAIKRIYYLHDFQSVRNWQGAAQKKIQNTISLRQC